MVVLFLLFFVVLLVVVLWLFLGVFLVVCGFCVLFVVLLFWASCLSMFSLILCIGTCPGPSIMTWQSCFQAIWGSSPSVSSSANCAASLASAMEPGRKPSPREKLTS